MLVQSTFAQEIEQKLIFKISDLSDQLSNEFNAVGRAIKKEVEKEGCNYSFNTKKCINKVARRVHGNYNVEGLTGKIKGLCNKFERIYKPENYSLDEFDSDILLGNCRFKNNPELAESILRDIRG